MDKIQNSYPSVMSQTPTRKVASISPSWFTREYNYRSLIPNNGLSLCILYTEDKYPTCAIIVQNLE